MIEIISGWRGSAAGLEHPPAVEACHTSAMTAQRLATLPNRASMKNGLSSAQQCRTTDSHPNVTPLRSPTQRFLSLLAVCGPNFRQSDPTHRVLMSFLAEGFGE
jgi:hypothetical protein